MTTRAVPLILIIASAFTVVVLVVASAVSPRSDEKTRPPLGEIRIEKVLDVQLPEV